MNSRKTCSGSALLATTTEGGAVAVKIEFRSSRTESQAFSVNRPIKSRQSKGLVVMSCALG